MKTRSLLATVAFCAVALNCVSARALDIIPTFDTGASETPGFDTTGDELTTLMEAAAVYWEDIIADTGDTLEIRFFYHDFGDTTAADTLITAVSGGKPTACRIRVDSTPAEGWYIDATPWDHDEYDMTQTLVGELLSGDRSDWYNDYPPDLLEVSFAGDALLTAPIDAQDDTDMFTTLLHEMGHGLGMISNTAAGEIGDGDYDFRTDQVWGATVAAEYNAPGAAYHLAAEDTLMFPVGFPGRRLLPSATDVLSISGAVDWTETDLPRKDFFDTGDGEWNTPLNWSGGRRPDAGDEVTLRHGGDV